ncbi:MAG TPA: MauE/DoxX family redox-associated membrane protein [Streptosporangiaceae bacterium]
MGVVALACRAAVAVLLVAAGGAKLADLAGFAATVRQFWPARMWPGAARRVAAAIAAAELALGAASLAWPRARWAGLGVLALSAGFVIVAVAGYRWHRGRPCRCFGALSNREFSLAGIGRAGLVALAAAVALAPAGSLFTRLSLPGRLGLLAGALLVALAARAAAASLAAVSAPQAGRQGVS